MKHLNITFLLTLLMSMLSIETFAHDIAVENVDGKTIYYVWTNNKTELAVSYQGSDNYSYSNEYSGDIVIPQTVYYNGKSYPVTSIGGSAFYGCSGLTSITIPNSVTSIGAYAFYGCSGLTSITIPEGVTSIGKGTFVYCSGLKSAIIGNSVTSIGYSAFGGCSSLKKVIVSDIKAWCSISFDGSKSNPLTYAQHLYSDEDTEITNLIIPDGVTTIEAHAFSGCSGFTSITIPNSVTTIEGYAFDGCTGLTSVTIPSSVTNLGRSFFMCSNLTSVTIESDAVVSATRKQTSSLNDIFGVQVKNYILGDEITSIGDYAFYNCSRLTSINIPKSLTKIGKYAFSGCSDLKKIIVTDIDAWCKIDFGEATSNPLYYAKRLYSDSDTEITEVVFPNGITAVGNYVFYNSTGLKSVTIPSSVTSIGDFAFYNCTSLSITLPDNIRSIGKKAFHEYARIRANNGTVTPLTLWNYGWTNGINDISTNYSFFAPALTATTTQTSINWTLSNYQAGYQYSIDDTALTGTTYSESVTGLCPEYGITHLLKVSLDDVSYSKYFTARTNDLNVSINSTNTTASSISLEGAYVAGDAEIESVALTLSGKTVNASSSLFTGLYPGSSYTAKYVVKVKYGDNQTRDYTATKTIKTAALTMTTAQPKVVSE